MPLIVHTIRVAREVKRIDRCVVSTDDSEIAAVARAHGAETPFLRPAYLAEDDTADLPVFQHALVWLQEHEGYDPAVVIHLRPTSPLRRADHVEAGLDLLLAHPEADAIRSVSPASQNPLKMWRVDDGVLRPLAECEIAEPYNAPRQLLPAAYWQNGYVDIAWKRTILGGSMTGRRILALVIERVFPVDLDTEEGFVLGEMVARRLGLVPE